MDSYLPDMTAALDSYSRVAILLMAGIVMAETGQRVLRLPRLTGYIIAGVLLGPAGLSLIPTSVTGEMRPLMLLALGLLLFEIGTRIDLHWLSANRILIWRCLLEALLTFTGAYTLLAAAGFVPATCMTVAAISVSTSPSVVMRVVAESNAKGQMTQQLLLFTGINSLIAILLLKVGVGFVHTNQQRDLWQIIGHPLYLLCGSILVAYALARLIDLLQRVHLRRESERFSLVIALVLLSTAIGDRLGLSVPMILLCGGMILRTTSARLQLFPEHFGSAGALLVILLFVLTGAALQPAFIAAGGLLSLGLIAIRAAAKWAGARFLAARSGLAPHKANWLGVALLPMSSLAVLQAYEVSGLYADFGDDVVAIVLGAVVVMEIISPVLTQVALRRAGETDDAPRTERP
jgi:Kef-type K+ transport system membrane component KefB